jgi:hypothetical protein
MTVCVTTSYLDLNSCFPVVDPRRTAGTGPHAYGYAFTWDGVVVRVERISASSNCEMTVVLTSTLPRTKGIQTWNLHLNSWTDLISTSGSGQPVSIVIKKPGAAGTACDAGADTVVLCQLNPWPVGWKALYYFPPEDFWDLWGGCKVTFDWQIDTKGSGLWGPQTPQPRYPFVRHPDGTLMSETLYLPGDQETTRYFVVFGGAAFSVGYGELGSLGLSTGSAIPAVPMPSTPADGTLVREWGRPEVYVVYGGAKFSIPDPDMLWALGFNWSDVRVIPSGGTSQLLSMPVDGTLLRGQGPPQIGGGSSNILLVPPEQDPGVYVVEGGLLRKVASTAALDDRCLSLRHVRTVPEASLASLPTGSDIG